MVQRKPQWTKLGRYDRLRGLLQIYVPRLTRGTGVYQEENRGLLRGRGFERYRYRLQPFRGCYPADYPWPKYGIVQDQEYPQWDFGYHPAMIEKFKAAYGYDPREQEDPSQDEKWLQFRCDQITEVANMIADVVHSYGKKMAASPFPTPKMASKMVRQDWGKWNLDIVFPMVYHNFYTEDISLSQTV